MSSESHKNLLFNPVFRVVATWIWFFVGAAITVLLILAVKGVGLSGAADVLGGQRHLVLYIEFVSVGLFPLVVTIFCRDDWKEYGFRSEGLVRSLALSLLFISIMYAIGLLTRGQIMSDDRPDLVLTFPLNIWYGVMGILTWGPLEVFFFAWLVKNTERIFKEGERRLSWGLAVTVIVFGLTHIVATNLFNAAYTSAIFLVVGLIYKWKGNIYGPMLAWTMINGQVWFMARLLF